MGLQDPAQLKHKTGGFVLQAFVLAAMDMECKEHLQMNQNKQTDETRCSIKDNSTSISLTTNQADKYEPGKD
jgi:hypothetical protein